MFTVCTANGVIWLRTADDEEAREYCDWLNNGGFEKTAAMLSEVAGKPIPGNDAGPAFIIADDDDE